MNTKILLASIATATTLGAPAAFASELYGPVDLSTGAAAAATSAESMRLVNDGRSSGELYGFENRRQTVVSATAAAPLAGQVKPTGELYGFENTWGGERAAPQGMAMTGPREAGFTSSGGELYGFGPGDASGGSRLVSGAIAADGPLTRGALYGFEAGQPGVGSVAVKMAEIGPRGPQTRGALYGFEAGRFGGQTDLGE